MKMPMLWSEKPRSEKKIAGVSVSEGGGGDGDGGKYRLKERSEIRGMGFEREIQYRERRNLCHRRTCGRTGR